MNTRLTISGRHFLINGHKTYEEIPECPERFHGLLMNARFIQGIFDDRMQPQRFNRFGRTFNPERNTDELIAALGQWYRYGLRGITVGLQGGGPCYTIDSNTIDNNPYSEDGRHVDPAYLARLERILRAADEIGMVVIVSCFYGPQSRFLKDDAAVMEALKSVCSWLREKGFANVIVEVANEHDIDAYKIHPILYNDSGIVTLIDIARRESGGMPVGCSSTGAYFSPEITNASDVILIHGNNMSPQVFYNQICQVKVLQPDRPIVCNEDSQALTNMRVALDEEISWGYYNNMTKQEPPVDWGITEGEDEFFACRMAKSLGIPLQDRKAGNPGAPKDPGAEPSETKKTVSEEPEPAGDFRIQGLKADESYEGKRWVRLAAEYPEKILRVDYYRNGTYYCSAYEAPFSIGFLFNWIQNPLSDVQPQEKWKAVITLSDGSVVIREAVAG